MSDTIFHGDLAFSSFGKEAAVYSFTNTAVRGDDAVTMVQIEVKDKVGQIAAWGKNNDYPQNVRKQGKKNGSVQSGIRILRKGHYGNGQIFIKDEVTEEGKRAPKLVPLFDMPAEVQDFYSKSQMNRFWRETIADLEWFAIAFPEYILSNDYKKINRVKRHRAAWCRFEIMNEETGLVENVYISEKFGKQSVAADSQYVSKVPLIDSYWSPDEVREYCKANGIKKFIRPIFYPLVDEAYYPEAEWHAVIESGWLEVANSIPEYKNNLFKNQVSIKYLIEIDERYFTQVYQSEWLKYTVDERKAIRKQLIDKINEHLGGNKNAGKSIQSMKFLDDKGNAISAITISTIDDKFKNGSYLPEAEAAESQVFVALGVDASLIGGAGIPGGALGAGSGSDKRVAFNIMSALFKTNRETTLEVHDFIRDYNGWDRSIKADFENTILTTLDDNPTGSQKMTA